MGLFFFYAISRTCKFSLERLPGVLGRAGRESLGLVGLGCGSHQDQHVLLVARGNPGAFHPGATQSLHSDLILSPRHLKKNISFFSFTVNLLMRPRVSRTRERRSWFLETEGRRHG